MLVDFDGPGPNPPVEVFSLLVDTDQDNAGASLRYRREAGEHQFLLGVNYGDTRNQGGNYRNLNGRRNGLRERVDNTADSLELFAMDRWSVTPNSTLVYGAQFVDATREVRVTNASTNALRNPEDNYSAFNPRLGVIRKLGENSEFFASASRLFEAPTNYEIEDDVRGSGATLDPMKGQVLEAGFRGTTDAAEGTAWHWDVSAYYASIDDEILSVDDPAAPGNSLTANIDGTLHAGIEALVGASFVVGRGRIEPQLSLTVNEFKFDSDPDYGDNRLPSAPRYAARGELLYRQGSLYLGPTFDFIGKRYVDFANTYTVDSHALLGLRGGYSTERLELFAEVRNLLDEEYFTTLSVMNQAGADARVLQPGSPLSAYAGVRFKLN